MASQLTTWPDSQKRLVWICGWGNCMLDLGAVTTGSRSCLSVCMSWYKITNNYWVSFRQATLKNLVSEAVSGFSNGSIQPWLSKTLIFPGFPVGNPCQKVFLGVPENWKPRNFAPCMSLSSMPLVADRILAFQCVISFLSWKEGVFQMIPYQKLDHNSTSGK